MEDKKLLQLLLQRSGQAIPALARAYGQSLRRTAMNILGDTRDAEECVNDTYLALWDAIPPAEPDPLIAYAQRVVRNICLKRLRQDRARKRRSEFDLSLEELAGCLPGGDLEQEVHRRLLQEALNRFLREQSKENRCIFLRRYWYGDSVGDIAQLLGMQRNAVTVRLRRLREKLQDYLIKEELL